MSNRHSAPTLLELDYARYPRKSDMPQFQKYYRKAQAATFPPLRMLYRVLFRLTRNSHLVDLSIDCDIGGGLYLGHPHCITINPSARIGHMG